MAVLVLIICFVIYVFKNKIANIIPQLKLTHWTEKQEDLVNHDLFFTIEGIVDNRLKYIEFPDQAGKSRLTQDFIRVKLLEIRNQTYTFVQREDIIKMSESELTREVFNLVNSIIAEHDKKWLELFTRCNIKKETQTKPLASLLLQ